MKKLVTGFNFFLAGMTAAVAIECVFLNRAGPAAYYTLLSAINLWVGSKLI